MMPISRSRRIASLPASLVEQMMALPDEMVIAVHDLLHDIMDARSDAAKRDRMAAALRLKIEEMGR